MFVMKNVGVRDVLERGFFLEICSLNPSIYRTAPPYPIATNLLVRFLPVK